MRLIVCDRETATQGRYLRGLSAHIVISIHDPERRPAAIPKRQDLRGVLFLAFDDAAPCPGLPLPDDLVLMSEEQARRIWRFVDQHRERVEVIVVHCEAGMSRSPAVAAALAKGLGLDPSGFFRKYIPNEHVYELLVRARASLESTS